MHASIAKAQAKGIIRSTQLGMERLEKQWWATAKNNKGHWGRKLTLKIMDYFCDRHGDLLLMKQKKTRRVSWHIDLIDAHISLHHDALENIGNVYPVIIEKISSRKFSKSVDGSHELLLEPQVGLHEHFLQRAIQRADWAHNTELKEEIVNIIIALSLQLPKLRNQSDQTITLHACISEHVIVATYHKATDIFVLNTLLCKSKFTCAQSIKYDECYRLNKQGLNFPILLSELEFRPIGAKYLPRTYDELIHSCESIRHLIGNSRQAV